MKNTLFFDNNFNFTLLENEENPDNSIYIKFHTSDAANQVLNILANASTITESLASDTDIVYELEQTNWTNNGATVIWLSNDDISSPKVKIIFSEIPTASCAINRGTNTVFLMQYEGQDEEESGGGSGGGSGSGGSGSDFVEIIRNIGFRLLDEPGNVSVEYDDTNNSVSIKWTDPADIATNEPVPAAWEGTVVVRKSGSAPLHKWDGTILVNSTTRDEYSVNALIDNNVTQDATYYYGIFPYHIALDDDLQPIKYYRYTKVIKVSASTDIEHSYRVLTSVKLDGIDYSLISFNDYSIITSINSASAVSVGDYTAMPDYIASNGEDFRLLLNLPFKYSPGTTPSSKALDDHATAIFTQWFNEYKNNVAHDIFQFAINTVDDYQHKFPGISFPDDTVVTYQDKRYYLGIILDDIQNVGWVIRLSTYITPFNGDKTVRVMAVGGNNQTGAAIYSVMQ